MKHLSLFWYTTLQTLLCLKGRYIEALNCGIPRYKPYHASMGGTLKHLTMVYPVKNLIMLNGRYIEALNYGIPRYKPCYGSRGGTLKHLTVVYHVTNLIIPQWEVH